MTRISWLHSFSVAAFAAPGDGSASGPSQAEPVRLLLVDDSRTNRMLALSMLQKMGYEPVAVEDGASAVEAVKNGDFAAVLMDVWMPDMDGIQATAAIRALDGPAGAIPIIAMTADTDKEDRKRCLDAGMNDFISKPVDRITLAEAIERLTGAADTMVADESAGTAPFIDTLIDDGVLNQLRIDAGPDMINEFVAAYMLETEDRVKRMNGAIANDDLAAIAGDAHAMKSSSGTFGARRLHRLATAIETAAESGDTATAAGLTAMLDALVLDTWRAFARRGMRPGIRPESDG